MRISLGRRCYRDKPPATLESDEAWKRANCRCPATTGIDLNIKTARRRKDIWEAYGILTVFFLFPFLSSPAPRVPRPGFYKPRDSPPTRSLKPCPYFRAILVFCTTYKKRSRESIYFRRIGGRRLAGIDGRLVRRYTRKQNWNLKDKKPRPQSASRQFRRRGCRPFPFFFFWSGINFKSIEKSLLRAARCMRDR